MFEMEDLGPAKKILKMEISKNRQDGTLFLSQEGYIKMELDRFGITNAKPIITPIDQHFKLIIIRPEEKEEKTEKMNFVPYSNEVGSIMYVIVCSIPNLAYVARVISMFMSKPRKGH